MGAWGAGPFDNDDAADFIAEIGEAETALAARALATALTDVTKADGYVEAPELCRAVAAAAIVALTLTSDLAPPASLNTDSLARLQTTPALVSQARAALDRALDAHDNEWMELWADEGLDHEVSAQLAPFQAALNSSI